jgi:hypothetical protein
MLRHLPVYSYSGLTIILSNPSRFDKNELLSGHGAKWFFEAECLQPEMNRYQCDIRLIEDKSPLLPGTKVILLLGQRAQSQYTNTATTLDENRGSPFIVNGIPCISSFTPQDACDMQNYELKFNAEAVAGNSAETESEDIDGGDIFESKSRGRTDRANYRFWLKQDTKKAIRILNNGGQLPKLYETNPVYHICPDPDHVINHLRSTKHQDFLFDMETDFYSLDMRCFGYSFGNDPYNIYVVPILDTNYKPFYGNKTFHILRALAVACRDNCIVAHNGAAFDFFVLAFKLGIPIGSRCYDTLSSQHRIFPKPEKSLGHCVSLWTYEPYHKNEAVHGYHNREQLEKLLLYCGKDVFTMWLVKRAQLEFAAKDPGLQASIKAANRAIKPYLTSTLLGMHFNDTKRQALIKNNDRLMYQMLRIMKTLTGPDVGPLISNKRCVDYFHKQLNYKVMGRTKTDNASLAKDNLLKLRLAYENPVIDALLAYRRIEKETSTLNWKTWKIFAK